MKNQNNNSDAGALNDGHRPSPTCYEPTAEDIQWARNLVSAMNDGGIWFYRTIPLGFKFDHAAATMTVIRPEGDDPQIRRCVEQSRAVFAKVGYRVVE